MVVAHPAGGLSTIEPTTAILCRADPHTTVKSDRKLKADLKDDVRYLPDGWPWIFSWFCYSWVTGVRRRNVAARVNS